MASLSNVSRSNGNYLSSLMNSANTITGLASGLDTESMIENLVKSHQAKINQLNQKITKVEWKQDAYRSIISQLVSLSNKYTSYTSSTNLMSRSFFTNSVKVSALGKFADAVTASGKTSSDVSLNAVRQLATAAQYRTSSNMASENTKVITGEDIDLFSGDQIELSNLSGSLSLTYGSQKIKISFDEANDVEAMNKIRARREANGESTDDADVLADLINQKLADQKITFTGSGETEGADKRIQASVSVDAKGNKSITFKELGTAGNGVYISGASGNIADQFGLKESDLKNASKTKPQTISTNTIKDSDGNQGLTRKMSGIEYLAEKSSGSSGGTMSITLDGTTKSITLPHVAIVKNDADSAKNEYYLNGERIKLTAEEEETGRLTIQEKFTQKYTEALKDSVNKAFGDKVSVENVGENGSLKLEFTVKEEGSALTVNSAVGDALGIGKTATNYLSTSKTLGELLEMDDEGGLKGLNSVGKDADGNEQYEFWLNGVKVGTYTKDTKLSELMDDINKSEAGVKVSYSQTTKNFLFESKETGADSKVEFGEGLAKAMFGVSVNSEDTVSKVFKGADKWGDEDKEIYFKIPGGNGVSFSVSSDMTMKEIVSKLNDEFKAEKYTIAYDNITGKIVATGKDGKTQEVEIALAHSEETQWAVDQKLEYANDPKISYTKGQDAIFDVTVNGERIQMTRSSNSVNIDGLTITANDTFDATVDENGNEVKNIKDAVTFKSTTDSDKIVDAIKTMITEYNAVMAEVKSAYSTMPYQNSNGAFGNFDPLTDEDMESMSESAIARYEEKAKQGILFGDQTLSGLYNKMLDVFNFSNTADVDTLKEMGITVEYNNGLSSISLDEDKLRSILDSDPDRVADLFTKSDGIMNRMKTQLDNYAKTVGEPKGILIQRAGSPLSSLSMMSNSWQDEIDNYNEQIARWQTKMESQVERYTSQFARLEQLINQMNSQSSALAGMLGG